MISAESKKRAACAANRIISTAPIEKLGTISARAPGAAASHCATCAGPGVVEPGGADDGVQALADAPAQVVHDRARVGEVDHDVAAGQRVAVVAHIDARRPASCPAPPATAAHICVPMRPLAPSTPTLIMSAMSASSVASSGGRCQDSAAAKLASSSNGPTTASALGRSRISAATRRTSSWVTASIEARISSTGSSRG